MDESGKSGVEERRAIVHYLRVLGDRAASFGFPLKDRNEFLDLARNIESGEHWRADA